MAKKSKAKASKRPAKGARGPKRALARAVKSAKKASKKSAKKKSAKAKSAKKSSSGRSAGRARKAKAEKTVGSAARRTARRSSSTARPRKAAEARTPAATGKRPNLERERRTVREEEEMVPSPPSSLNMDRTASAVRTGRAEYEQRLREHTSTGPAMTGGDIDADWEDAEAVGDEAPGGDNPTPDQDVVDEIGRAIGIEYDDDEELQGGDELTQRDRHRWELDPASKEDFEDE